MVNQTINAFGVQIEYDTEKRYGIYNCKRAYGILPVEKTLPKLIAAGDKEEFVEFLNFGINRLQAHLKGETMLDALVETGAMMIVPPVSEEIDKRQREEIQNTIDLFQNISDKLAV
jgi:hypothetical protein